MEQPITFKPIGTVHNDIKAADRGTVWEGIESEIAIDPRWQPALDGLDEFSHIWIVFHFDRIPPPDSTHVRPMHLAELPLVGRFSTRTPQRPNPIGITPVELLEVRGNVLRVRGLEALDGTPVLDIKPYLPRGDSIPNARVGEWVKKYWSTL